MGADNWERMASGGGDPGGGPSGFPGGAFSGGFTEFFSGGEIRFEGGTFDLGDMFARAQKMVRQPAVESDCCGDRAPYPCGATRTRVPLPLPKTRLA